MAKTMIRPALSAAAIVSLDLEMIVYRKGCLHAHLNLEQGYITWRDSGQWCNSFTRTISDEQIRTIRTFLQKSDLLEQLQEGDMTAGEDEDEQEGLAQNTRTWLITAQWPDQQIYHANGIGILPECWHQLKQLIEKLSRVSFYL